MISYKTIRFAVFSLMTLCATLSYAQVGINTTTPNGALEISSSTNGVVFPRVALTASNVATPVVNPNGGSLAPGTTVFNTNATTTGSNDVYVGKYYWDGSRWEAQFSRMQSQLYTQDMSVNGSNPNNDFIGFRARANGGFQDIHGLDDQTFTADYTGTYRIAFHGNYGAGQIRTPAASQDGTFVAGQGFFRLRFDGTNYDRYVNSASTFNNSGAGAATNYFAIGNHFTQIIYVELTAGETYDFNLSFDQFTDVKLINNGNSANGRGVVGILTPSTIEITFADE